MPAVVALIFPPIRETKSITSKQEHPRMMNRHISSTPQRALFFGMMTAQTSTAKTISV